MSEFRDKASRFAPRTSLRPVARPVGLGTAPTPRPTASPMMRPNPSGLTSSSSSTRTVTPSSSSPEEREVLAKTLEAEAGGEGREGMLAVGAVISNRTRADRWGDSITDVIMAPGQYSAWNRATGYLGGRGGLDMDRMRPSETAYSVADTILSGDYEDPTGGATHYYNPRKADPPWGERGGGEWRQVGNHVFGVPKGERGVTPHQPREGNTAFADSGRGGGSSQSASASTRPQERPVGLRDAVPSVRPQGRPDRGPETSLRPTQRPEGYMGVQPRSRPMGPETSLLPVERPGDFPWNSPEPVARPTGLGGAVVAGIPGYDYDPLTGRIFERR